MLDQKNQYKSDIQDIVSENQKLSKELVEVESLTRKSIVGNYEDKYKHLLDSFKEQTNNDINYFKTSLKDKELDIKKRDMKIRDLQLNIKKLESELNRQFSKDPNYVDDNYVFNKVIRSRNDD